MDYASTPRAARASRAIRVGCADADGMRVNGVYFGPACALNPPCGQAMSLVPSSASNGSACGRLLAVARAEPRGSCAAGERHGERPAGSRGGDR